MKRIASLLIALTISLTFIGSYRVQAICVKKSVYMESDTYDSDKIEKTKRSTVFVGQNPQEKFINSKNLSSSTKYLVWVDLNHGKHMTYVFQGSKNKWRLVKSFVCSGGRDKRHDTIRGQFTISTKGKWFFSKKYQQGGEYWVRFKGSYLFHSLPMNKRHKIVDYTLGKGASHGCIRLEVNNAKWIYNNLKKGTKVYIP